MNDTIISELCDLEHQALPYLNCIYGVNREASNQTHLFHYHLKNLICMLLSDLVRKT